MSAFDLVAAQARLLSEAPLRARFAADPDLASRLGRAGRDIARERFDTRALAARLEDRYLALSGGIGSPPGRF